MNRKIEKKCLLLILILALLLRLSFVFFVPIWQSADEYPHFYYIQYLAENRTLPLSQPYFPNYQCFQPPLYYFIGSVLYSLLPSGNTAKEEMGSDELLEMKANFPNTSNPIATLLRLISVIFGMLSIYLTYLLSKTIFPDNPEAVLGTTAFVAFLPTFVSNTASISNDPLAVLLSLIVMFHLLNMRIWGFKQILISGIILGLAILTKYNLLALIPIIFFILYFNSPKKVWYRFPLVVFFSALTCLFWIIHNLKTYQNILPINPGYALHDYFWNRNLNETLHTLRNLFWSFWATAGRIYEIHFPAWYYILIFGGLSLLATIGLIKLLTKSIRNNNVLSLYQKRALIVFAVYVIFLFAGSLHYSLSYEVMTSWGKNLFPGIFAIALFFILGLANLSGRYKRGIILSFVLILILSDLILLFFYLIPYYY